MLTVADLCPYWTWPPTGGGPLRVYNMNRVVSQRVQVLQFSARPTLGHRHNGAASWLRSRNCLIAERYREYQYFHPLILGTSYLLYRLHLHSDIFLSPVLRWLSPRQLGKLSGQASIFQVEHPWLFKLALRLANGRPVIYVAHNVEAKLWEAFANQQGTPFPRLALRPRILELEAVQGASTVVAMSPSDAAFLVSEYGADPARIHVIPNGVDLEARRAAALEEKSAARSRLRLDDRPMAIFVGSDHYPNKQALQHLLRWQSQVGPELGMQFVVVGGVGHGARSTDCMTITGFVEDVTDYLMAADVGLNPLISGSGTSLKVVEYLACGLPTITTRTGMRGLELVPGRDVLMGEIDDFPGLMAMLVADQNLRAKLSHNGRRVVEQNYSWEALAKRMLDIYERVGQCESACLAT